MNQVLLDLIRENKGNFRCSFSISGVALEQFEEYTPDVLDQFKALADTGCVDAARGVPRSGSAPPPNLEFPRPPAASRPAWPAAGRAAPPR